MNHVSVQKLTSHQNYSNICQSCVTSQKEEGKCFGYAQMCFSEEMMAAVVKEELIAAVLIFMFIRSP